MGSILVNVHCMGSILVNVHCMGSILVNLHCMGSILVNLHRMGSILYEQCTCLHASDGQCTKSCKSILDVQRLVNMKHCRVNL